jgi:hypothetical protein
MDAFAFKVLPRYGERRVSKARRSAAGAAGAAGPAATLCHGELVFKAGSTRTPMTKGSNASANQQACRLFSEDHQDCRSEYPFYSSRFWLRSLHPTRIPFGPGSSRSRGRQTPLPTVRFCGNSCLVGPVEPIWTQDRDKVGGR